LKSKARDPRFFVFPPFANRHRGCDESRIRAQEKALAGEIHMGPF
jgi:hypothetical protein